MPQETTFDAAMARARRPALLVDVGAAAFAALKARDSAPDEASRAAAELRWAALVRRSAPDEALKTLDRLGAAAAGDEGRRIRLHALLDAERFAEARALSAPSGATAADGLIAARLACVLDREEALRISAGAMAGVTDPEIEADLRCVRARWLAEAGDLDAARAEADALIALCQRHEAASSRLMAQLMRLGFDAIGGGAEEKLDVAIAAAVEGIQIDPRTLGPLPAHLHGLMVRYAGRTRDAKAFVLSVVSIADLASAAQRFETAFETLFDGAELARRVFGDGAAAPIAKRYDALATRLGPERIAALHAWRRRRTEMLLRRMGH